MIQQVNLAAEKKNRRCEEVGSAAGVQQKQQGLGAHFYKCDHGRSSPHGAR